MFGVFSPQQTARMLLFCTALDMRNIILSISNLGNIGLLYYIK
jgi:hypothetical protein